MQVMRAVEQARLARAILQDFSMQDARDLSELIDEIYSALNLYLYAIDFSVSDEIAIGIWHQYFKSTNFGREYRLCDRLVRRLVRLRNRLDYEFSPPLLEAFLSILSFVNVLSDTWSAISFNLIISEVNYARNLANGLREMLDNIRLLGEANTTALAIADAWIAIGDVSSAGKEPNTHEIAIRDFDGSYSISECREILKLLDTILRIASAEIGDITLASTITVERFETGTFDAVLKAIPPQLWGKVQEILTRMTNQTGARLTNIDTARVLLESIQDSENTNRLTNQYADALRQATLESIGILTTMQNATVEVDGKLVGSIGATSVLPDVRETPALPAPTTTTP